jgi:hypothetical protein
MSHLRQRSSGGPHSLKTMTLYVNKRPGESPIVIKVYSEKSPGFEYEEMTEEQLSEWLAEHSSALTEEPPEPNWEQFKRIAMKSQALANILLIAQSQNPQTAGWLHVGLARAESGNLHDFIMAWSAVVQSAQVPSEVVAGFVGIATACHLPSDFVSALQAQAD